MLSTLMAQNQNNLKQLCEQTLARLTKYMRVNAAILYVARVDLETHTMKLYMQANFGLTREQIEKAKRQTKTLYTIFSKETAPWQSKIYPGPL